MSNTFSVSVGIPAYNEDQTIRSLLSTLLSQQEAGYVLKELIVVSDASTDATESEVLSLKSPNITLLKNKNRLGVAQSINRILEHAQSDALVILNADILIKDNELITKLIAPIVQKTGEVVSGNIVNIPPTSLVDTVLAKSFEIKNELYAQINRGDNMFTCHGPIRALSKKFYTQFRLIDNIADDMYMYYFAKVHKFSYQYVPEAVVYYKLPTTLREHVAQSKRFFVSLKNSRAFFARHASDIVEFMPSIFVRFALHFFVKHPLYAIIYLVIQARVCLSMFFSIPTFTQSWDVITSSKKLS